MFVSTSFRSSTCRDVCQQAVPQGRKKQCKCRRPPRNCCFSERNHLRHRLGTVDCAGVRLVREAHSPVRPTSTRSRLLHEAADRSRCRPSRTSHRHGHGLSQDLHLHPRGGTPEAIRLGRQLGGRSGYPLRRHNRQEREHLCQRSRQPPDLDVHFRRRVRHVFRESRLGFGTVQLPQARLFRQRRSTTRGG